jgi:hypothetical protein
VTKLDGIGAETYQQRAAAKAEARKPFEKMYKEEIKRLGRKLTQGEKNACSLKDIFSNGFRASALAAARCLRSAFSSANRSGVTAPSSELPLPMRAAKKE